MAPKMSTRKPLECVKLHEKINFVDVIEVIDFKILNVAKFSRYAWSN